MKVGIVGFGQMGTGIAQVCAMAGYDTLVFDTNHKILEQNHSKLLDTLAGLVSKGKLRDYDLNQVRSNLHIATELKQFADRDIVIEAVIENPQVKAEVLKDLSLICSRNTIIASNTSSIAITFLASHVDFPNRVIGIHFMNPVPLMKLVEIIRGLQTDDQTYELSLRFVK
ncbi:MAG: 3-hydroxyacyl-CoA dehydrogenase NAD-binding domain-containing protein, partial [Deltaproteobacteria bacterium]|nr:3-hydroxyacyl-CoA dehydrogenase NAD-binding domain-containing protein [Deltaproteobacteria bacterium]